MGDKAQELRLKAIQTSPNTPVRSSGIKPGPNLSVRKVRTICFALSVERQQRRPAAPWTAWAGVQPVDQGKSLLLLHSTQQTTSRILCPFLGGPVLGRYQKIGRGPPVWSGLKHLLCEKRLREPGLLSLGKSLFQWDLTAAPATSGEDTLPRQWSQVLHSGSQWEDDRQWV